MAILGKRLEKESIKLMIGEFGLIQISVLYMKYFKKATNKTLLEEFYKHDSSRIHFCVVAGRRKHFNEKTYRLVRNEMKQTGIQIFHYDNLYDFANELIKKRPGYLSY